MDECKYKAPAWRAVSPRSLKSVKWRVPSRWKQRACTQGLTLVHFLAQPEPFWVTEPLKLPIVSMKMCLRLAEKWTSVNK